MPLLIIELDESIWLVLIACCCVGELDKVGYQADGMMKICRGRGDHLSHSRLVMYPHTEKEEPLSPPSLHCLPKRCNHERTIYPSRGGVHPARGV